MMPVLDGRDLLVLHAVALLSGLILGGIFMIFSALYSIIPQKDNKIYRVFLKFLPRFFIDTLFSLIFTVWNVLMFSAYGGGSVRISAIIAELISWACLSVLVNSLVRAIKRVKKAREKKQTAE